MIHRIDSAVEIIAIGVKHLDNITEDGGFICDESLSDIRLQQAEQALRGIADAVKARRQALRANEPIMVAAE